MTDLSNDHVRVLTALRRASMLRREPRPLAPEGQVKWHNLTDLEADGWFGGLVNLAALDRAARGLYKQHLVSRRTLHTVVHWGITEEGLLALYAYDHENDLSGVSGAALELDQANEDLRRLQDQLVTANAAVKRAMRRMNEAVAMRQQRAGAMS